MENSTRIQENQSPCVLPSPKGYSTNSSSSSTSSGGLQPHQHHPHHHHHHHLPPPSPIPPPQTPVPITRSEPNNPYPTTFVQADTTTFKQVVQMLTGSSETAKLVSGSTRPEPGSAPVKNYPIPPIKNGPKKEKSASKLYERRNSLKNFKLSPLAPGLVNRPGFSSNSPRHLTPEILSPSLLDFPSLALSPVTPLIPDPFNRSPHSGSSTNSNLDTEAEDKAIANKEFYFHPSPTNTPRDSEPRLLPLFPVTSPRVSGSSCSDS